MSEPMALEKKEPRDATVTLLLLEGCSLAKTAQRLGKTESAVAGLLHRGLQRLREMRETGE